VIRADESSPFSMEMLAETTRIKRLPHVTAGFQVGSFERFHATCPFSLSFSDLHGRGEDGLLMFYSYLQLEGIEGTVDVAPWVGWIDVDSYNLTQVMTRGVGSGAGRHSIQNEIDLVTAAVDKSYRFTLTSEKVGDSSVFQAS